MLKTIAFGALILCATAFINASCDLEKATVTRHLISHAHKTSIVPFKGHFYTVTKVPSHIYINSTDGNHQFCDIVTDPEIDCIRDRVDVIPTEDEIFIVGVHTSNSEMHEHKHTILKVDPVSCSYQSVATPVEHNSKNHPKIVKHQTGFDVFFTTNLQDCAPCRFDNVGSRISDYIPEFPRESIIPSGYSVKHDVHFIKSMNAYLYVYQSFNFLESSRISKLKLIDGDNLTIKGERIINGSVYASKETKESLGYLGFCSKSPDPSVTEYPPTSNITIHCDRLNSNFETINTIVIPTAAPYSNWISTVSYEFDSKGNSYISFAEIESMKLRLYIHDKNGQLIKAIDMGDVDQEFKGHFDVFDSRSTWEVNGFLMGDQYCIAIDKFIWEYSRKCEEIDKIVLESTKPLHHVKCIDITKYIKNL